MEAVMSAILLTTATHPSRDVVLYDGGCRFCRGQMAILRRLDPTGRLQLTSLHDPVVEHDFPELSRELLLEEMIVIDRAGRARAGASAWRHLTRRLPLLWPLALPLHVPGSLPLWNGLYRLIARNRYRFAGTCDDGSCRLR
jgi:predicted DCC family thiol-disulfide oxidoreductase YuxK